MSTSTTFLQTSYPLSLDLVLAAVRLFLGAMIFVHGFQKVFRGEGLAKVAAQFGAIGMKSGKVNAFAAAYTEMGAGALLVLGLLTPLASASLVGVMVIAIGSERLKNGFSLGRGGYEYCLAIAVMALVPGTIGAGKFSLDHAWGVFSTWSPTTDLLVTLLLGVGAGLLQLVVFFRPPSKA